MSEKKQSDRGTLPHYAVERHLWGSDADSTRCPVCAKTGRWDGDVFVPTDERGGGGDPPCKCGTIHKAGGYAYDPVRRAVLVREVARE